MKTETDFLFNRKDTAEAMGVTTQAVGLWNLDQAKKPNSIGNRVYYDIREVIKWKMGKERESGRNAPDYTIEKTRLTKQQADKVTLEVKKLKAELIPFEEVINHWENMFLAFRAKILAIPPKAAIVALSASSIPEIEESLEAFLVEALTELSGSGMPNEYQQMRQISETDITATTQTNG